MNYYHGNIPGLTHIFRTINTSHLSHAAIGVEQYSKITVVMTGNVSNMWLLA